MRGMLPRPSGSTAAMRTSRDLRDFFAVSARRAFVASVLVACASSHGTHRARDARESGVAPALPAMTRPAFLVGYNEAWFGKHYGSDLTTNYDRAVVEKTFDGIVQAGGRVVRLWLFEGREGLVLGAGAPETRGLSPAMLTNLGETLAAARARGLWVYLTAFDGNEMPVEVGPRREYFRHLLEDELGEGVAFRTNALAPLLTMLGDHREVIYGLDLLNEIQAPRSRSFWRDPVAGPRAFIQRTTAFIKTRAPWLRVTSSAGWDEGPLDVASGFFSGLGLDFYDVHLYADDGDVPGAAAICARASTDGVDVIVGEFGQKNRIVDDALQTSATESLLTNAKKHCFRAALAWRWDATEQWWNFAQPNGSFRPAVTVVQRFSALR